MLKSLSFNYAGCGYGEKQCWGLSNQLHQCVSRQNMMAIWKHLYTKQNTCGAGLSINHSFQWNRQNNTTAVKKLALMWWKWLQFGLVLSHLIRYVHSNPPDSWGMSELPPLPPTQVTELASLLVQHMEPTSLRSVYLASKIDNCFTVLINICKLIGLSFSVKLN